jgi:internalin A
MEMSVPASGRNCHWGAAVVDYNARDQLFISYSHRDESWLEEFVTMLAPVQKSGSLNIWSDKEIRAGEDWSAKIQEAICRAKIALLLVSGAFLASDFIQKSELPKILPDCPAYASATMTR